MWSFLSSLTALTHHSFSSPSHLEVKSNLFYFLRYSSLFWFQSLSMASNVLSRYRPIDLSICSPPSFTFTPFLNPLPLYLSLSLYPINMYREPTLPVTLCSPEELSRWYSYYLDTSLMRFKPLLFAKQDMWSDGREGKEIKCWINQGSLPEGSLNKR